MTSHAIYRMSYNGKFEGREGTYDSFEAAVAAARKAGAVGDPRPYVSLYGKRGLKMLGTGLGGYSPSFLIVAA